jgi:hypothetical protein
MAERPVVLPPQRRRANYALVSEETHAGGHCREAQCADCLYGFRLHRRHPGRRILKDRSPRQRQHPRCELSDSVGFRGKDAPTAFDPETISILSARNPSAAALDRLLRSRFAGFGRLWVDWERLVGPWRPPAPLRSREPRSGASGPLRTSPHTANERPETFTLATGISSDIALAIATSPEAVAPPEE